jgi:transglutaminase-like putative cysteine protease
MFRNKKMQRVISSVVLAAFTSMTLQPLTAAAQASASATPPVASSPDARLSQLFAELQEQLKAAVPASAFSPRAKQSGKISLAPDDPKGRGKRIRGLGADIRALYREVEQGFEDTGKHLAAAGAAPAIMERQRQAVAQYGQRKAEFDTLLDGLAAADERDDAAGRNGALAALGTFMASNPGAASHQYTDPNRLPFHLASTKARAPRTSAGELQAALFPPTYRKVLLAGEIPPGTQLAQAALPATPTPQDTAETEEVQLTPAIRAQAGALGNDATRIYQWVRNNIRFVPSYGSIQGSELTYQNRRGNAFDTASLLVALYRAANIPARYVYGTVDIPAEKAMNWVGGVNKPEAVQNLLGQGGIPNVGLVAGGKVAAIRLEHVWVEAYVDYRPSRGAVKGTPNTWVPLDASFKQYTYTAGMDLKNAVALDAAQVAAQAQQGATVDSSRGYVQNLNQANVQNQLSGYKARLKDYMLAHKADATRADVLGTATIVGQQHAILLGSLPYKTVAVGQRFAAMPDSLRWRFKTNIYAGGWYADGSSPYIELNSSTAKLAGKRVSLSFVPASQADQDLVNSYMPRAHADGSPVLPGELPKTLPGYLIRMKAQLRVNGQVTAESSDSFTLGSEVRQANAFFNPSTGAWEGGDDNDLTVGEFNAIGLDLQGIGQQQLRDAGARLAATQARLAQFQANPSDTGVLAGITRDELTGDIVQAAMTSYFAKVDDSDDYAANSADRTVHYRLPSYGRMFMTVQTQYYFGMPRNVSFPGVGVDVDYLQYHAEARDGSAALRAQFTLQAGQAASLAEATVPQEIFGRALAAPGAPVQPQGMSAVQVLGIAAAQGQKIYTLGDSNRSQHSSILQELQVSEDVKSEIANALAVGKTVTVHAQDVQAGGWSGAGYIVQDKDTGAGAYKLAGGSNGGSIEFVGEHSDGLGFTFFMLGLIAGAFAGPVIIALVAIVGLVISLMAFAAAYLDALDRAQCPEAVSCMQDIFLLLIAFQVLLAVVGFFVYPVLGLALGLIGLIFGDSLAGAASRACSPLACRTVP